MSDALPLPSQPHLGYYKKLAKDLVKACGDPAALRAWAARFAPDQIERAERHIRSAKIDKLADAQFLIARAHGFASWPKFARHVDDLRRRIRRIRSSSRPPMPSSPATSTRFATAAR